MAESTKTLTSLRREICTALQMPFFRRYPNGYLELESGSTTSKVVNASLTQTDKFWNGAWFYNKEIGHTSLIRSFASNDNSFFLEVPAASANIGDDFEIQSGWNAIDILHAINRSITEAGRSFPETVEDKTLILQTDKLEYDISTLSSKTPWIITKVFVEHRGNVQRGEIQSATGTTFTVENSGVFTNVVTASNWRVSIYDGTGAGQIRALVSTSGAEGTVAAWTTNPDSTSRYALWDAAEDMTGWIPYDGYRLDNKEFPSTLYLNSRVETLYGMRIAIEFMALPSELSAETDTTIIPEGYIIPASLSFLYGQRIPHTKADKEVYYAESERYLKMAEKYLLTNRPTRPDISLRSPQRTQTIYRTDNPLDW